MAVVGLAETRRGDVLHVDLNPTRGGGIRKTRPCLVVSPDELNSHLTTVVVAPMTTGSHTYSFRIPCRFQGKGGNIVLDQIRTIDRDRVAKVLGRLPEAVVSSASSILREMFSP